MLHSPTHCNVTRFALTGSLRSSQLRVKGIAKGITPLILNLDSIRMWVDNFTPSPLYPGRKTTEIRTPDLQARSPVATLTTFLRL